MFARLRKTLDRIANHARNTAELKRQGLETSARNLRGMHVERGDLSVLDPKCEILHQQFLEHAVVMAWCDPEVVRENIALCLPYLLTALAGSVDAKQQYQATRGINRQFLPEWGVSAIIEHYKIRLGAFNAMVGVVGADRNVEKGVNNYIKDVLVPNAIELEPLRALFTYRQCQGVLKLANSTQRQEPCVEYDLRKSGNNRGYRFKFCFRFSDKTRAGQLFSTTFGEVTNLALRIQIIEDYCSIHGIEPSTSIKRRLLRDGNIDPWAQNTIRDLNTLLHVNELVLSEANVPVDERSRWIDRLFDAKNPEKLLKSSFPLVHNTTARVTPPSVIPDQALNSFNERRLFIDGIAQALAIYVPASAQDDSVIRHLYALIRRGHSSYDEVISALRDGENPRVLVHTLRAKARSATMILQGLEEVPEQLTSVEQELDRGEIIVVDDRMISGWLSSLRGRNAEVVTTRLERVRQGNLGDCRRLPGHLLELRIHSGPGIRIYAWPKSTNELVVVHGGIKDDQDADIETARRRVQMLECA